MSFKLGGSPSDCSNRVDLTEEKVMQSFSEKLSLKLEGTASEFPYWADLPQLVLQLISEKLKSITDFIRFRAVCSRWRSCSLPKPHHLPPQLPWLMLPYYPIPHKNDDGIRLFYDLWKAKMHQLHLPAIIGKRCCASLRGWLLFIETEGREVFLLNPITRARIVLPPLTAGVRYLREDWDAPRHDTPQVFSSYRGYPESKVIFSCDPTDPDCLITLFLYHLVIFCCRVGEPCWTIINSPLAFAPNDAMYYNGRFHLLFVDQVDERVMVTFDINKPEKRLFCYIDNDFEAGTFRFLEWQSEVYLVAFKLGVRYELYQFQEQPFKLKKVTDKNNTTIFYIGLSCLLAFCPDDCDSIHEGYVYNFWYKSPKGKVGYYLRIISDKPEGETEQVWDLDMNDGVWDLVMNDGSWDLVEDDGVWEDLDEEVLIEPTEFGMWFQPSFV